VPKTTRHKRVLMTAPPRSTHPILRPELFDRLRTRMREMLDQVTWA
jgi:hypothetical protein